MIASIQSPLPFSSSVNQSVTHFSGRTESEVRIKVFLIFTEEDQRISLFGSGSMKIIQRNPLGTLEQQQKKKSSFATQIFV